MNVAIGNDEQKVKEVAAALEAGYHKDADAGKYEIAPQFQSDAQSSYQKVKQELQSNDITHQYGDLYGAPSNDISDPGYLVTHTQLVQDILNYDQNHSLDKKTAYPQNVSVTDKSGKTVNDSNLLVMDSTTKESNKFSLSNYNGGVNITDLPKGYEVILMLQTVKR